MELPTPNSIQTPIITGNSDVTMTVISEGVQKYDCLLTKQEETEEKLKQSDSKQINDDTVVVEAG